MDESPEPADSVGLVFIYGFLLYSKNREKIHFYSEYLPKIVFSVTWMQSVQAHVCGYVFEQSEGWRSD